MLLEVQVGWRGEVEVAVAGLSGGRDATPPEIQRSLKKGGCSSGGRPQGGSSIQRRRTRHRHFMRTSVSQSSRASQGSTILLNTAPAHFTFVLQRAPMGEISYCVQSVHAFCAP